MLKELQLQLVNRDTLFLTSHSIHPNRQRIEDNGQMTAQCQKADHCHKNKKISKRQLINPRPKGRT
jgi:hypothetical protein